MPIFGFLPALVGLLLAAIEPPSGRGFGRRRGAAHLAALTAQDAMKQAFFEMDSLQRETQVRAAFAARDGSPAGRSLAADYGQVSARVDAAAQLYLDALDRHDIDQHAGAQELDAARAAFDAACQQLRAGVADLNSFSQRSAAQVQRVEAALAEVRRAVKAATDDIAAAQRSIAKVTETGLQPVGAIAALSEAQRLLAPASSGTGDLAALAGVPAAAAAAGAKAREAARLAEGLPAVRDGVVHRLSSIQTRLQVLENRGPAIETSMSTLRRLYVFACFADIANAPQTLSTALESARQHTREAQRYASPPDPQWEAAAESLKAASSALQQADEAANAASVRAERLAQIAQNPRAEVEAARLRLRDAQRLLLSRPGSAQAQLARELDGLAGELDSAPAMLEGAHPDYWAYSKRLQDISRRAAATAPRIRTQFLP